METYPVIIGTAGHIDHGKTSLVRALTGIDTDRLKVEKERGITTELGFAHLDLQGRRFGVVDVPGHERFIKAMVAGAAGLDLVCLVIAADEGIMPQTREHLDICQLLGVRAGIVVLSKSDLVDAEWLELVQSEVAEHLADTFLADAPIVPVSTKTGDGLDRLKQEIVDKTQNLSARSAEGRLRMPVDRVFTVKGFGTVITGTVTSGSLAVGDDVVLFPRSTDAKVRGLQVHGADVSRARAGMRCAINVSGVATSDVARGDVLCHQGAIDPSHILDVRFRYLATSKAPLPRRSQVLVHHGSAQRTASLVLVDDEELAPGSEGLAQLRLAHEDALVALPGDRFLCRGFETQAHYGTTIGGGEVIRVRAAKVRASAEHTKEVVRSMAEATARDKIALEVKAAQAKGRTTEELGRLTGHPPQELGTYLQALTKEGTLLRVGKGKLAEYLHSEELARLEKRAVDAVEAFHEAKPNSPGISTAELASRLPGALGSGFFDLLRAVLLERGVLEEEGEFLRRPGKGSMASSRTSDLEDRLEALYRQWGNTPEKPKLAAEEVGAQPRDVEAAVERLRQLGTVIKVTDDLFFHRDAIENLKQALRAHFSGNSELSAQEWKQMVGASRKWTIPLAEFFDREKFTLRVGDVRKARNL